MRGRKILSSIRRVPARLGLRPDAEVTDLIDFHVTGHRFGNAPDAQMPNPRDLALIASSGIPHVPRVRKLPSLRNGWQGSLLSQSRRPKSRSFNQHSPFGLAAVTVRPLKATSQAISAFGPRGMRRTGRRETPIRPTRPFAVPPRPFSDTAFPSPALDVADLGAVRFNRPGPSFLASASTSQHWPFIPTLSIVRFVVSVPARFLGTAGPAFPDAQCLLWVRKRH